MRSPSYIPSFYFYKFANAVSMPYTNLKAYESGAIDESGNILTTEGSIDDFEYFVIKLKKIFDDLPPGITKSRLRSYSGIMQLFAEEVETIGITQEQLIGLFEAHVTFNSNNTLSAIELFEEMSTGGMSTGSAPGDIGTPAEAPGANKGNISGYDPRMMAMDSRSGPVNMFQSVEMFNMTPQQYKVYKDSKAWRHIPDDETKRYLQRLQRRNKGMKIGVRDEESGEIFFLPHKEKSFMEEFNLEGLSILSEARIQEVDTVDQFTMDPDAFRESMARYNISEIDPSDSAIGRILSKTINNIDQARSSGKKANVDELVGVASLVLSSGEEFEELRKTDPETAALVVGAWDHFSGRDPSANQPIDGVGLVRGKRGIRPMLVDYKNNRYAIGTRIPSQAEDYGGFSKLIVPGQNPFEMAKTAKEFTAKTAETFQEDRPTYEKARTIAHQMMGTARTPSQRPKTLSPSQREAQEIALDVTSKGFTPDVSLISRDLIVRPDAVMDYVKARLQDDESRFGVAFKGSGRRIAQYRKDREEGKTLRPFISEPAIRGPEIFPDREEIPLTKWLRQQTTNRGGRIGRATTEDLRSWRSSPETEELATELIKRINPE